LYVAVIFLLCGGSVAAGELDVFARILVGDDLRTALGPVARITISPETTVINGPLADDGYVDYLAALNAVARRNIKTLDNSAVLYWQVVGRDAVWAVRRDSYFRHAYFRQLGVASWPAASKCFVAHADFIRLLPESRKSQLFGEADEASWQAERRFEAARTRPWTAEEFPEIAEWLERNESPLLRFVAGTRRRQYASAIDFGWENPRSQTAQTVTDQDYFVDPLLEPLYDVVQAMIARSMLRAGKGQNKKAWQDLEVCLRCARTVGRGPLRANADFAIAAERHALVAAVSYVEHGQLSLPNIAACLIELDRLPPPAGIAEKIDVEERFASLDVLASVPRRRRNFLLGFVNSPPFPRYHPVLMVGNIGTFAANWDDVLRYVNKSYDRAVDAARQPTRALQETALKNLTDEHLMPLTTAFPHRNWDLYQVDFFVDRPLPAYVVTAPLALRVTTTQFVGEAYTIFLYPGRFLRGALRADGDRIAWNQLFKAKLALKAFHVERGVYPPDLAKLVPRYLPVLPQDPFSEQSLRYRQEGEGFVLYSVGVNKQDDGGVVDPDDIWEGDIVVRSPARHELEEYDRD
jgi:hypothetical protein